MTITFYDIPSDCVGAWSSNTWKTRFCLNYKGIPYNTVWVEYPDIEELSKKLGLKPTGKAFWDASKDYYSLPAIHDPSTGVYISELNAIRPADSAKHVTCRGGKYLVETRLGVLDASHFQVRTRKLERWCWLGAGILYTLSQRVGHTHTRGYWGGILSE
ncbi:hypothetical protein D9613_006292 [Agrocybe pediades]|uniref:GST N-terminal domain-containing protein n=1 Tax=Agrocybe pediades TaxID=84607 RepID=A0A8H4VRP6_9AGAR|nr:hypothetical protein D9613_006292 [Agrocybe pediades]